MKTLCVFHPTMEERIAPELHPPVVAGQVVLVTAVIEREAAKIFTPDGKIPLGFVLVKSLKPVSKRVPLQFDPMTGHTRESVKNIS